MGCDCYMALSASAMCHLSADQLRQTCREWGLISDEPVRSLGHRLAETIKIRKMDQAGPQEAVPATVPTDLLWDNTGNTPPSLREVSHGGSEVNPVPVLLYLLRQVPPQAWEEPEEILRLFVRLGEVRGLVVVDDRQFIIRILPLVSGSLLKFLSGCLRQGCGWAECSSQLLDEYFPYFVRERLVRDLIVFHFHAAGQSMRYYVEQVFRAASFFTA